MLEWFRTFLCSACGRVGRQPARHPTPRVILSEAKNLAGLRKESVQRGCGRRHAENRSCTQSVKDVPKHLAACFTFAPRNSNFVATLLVPPFDAIKNVRAGRVKDCDSVLHPYLRMTRGAFCPPQSRLTPRQLFLGGSQAIVTCRAASEDDLYRRPRYNFPVSSHTADGRET